MTNEQLITKIEELSISALPALQTQIYDGWILRFSEGYTKRANSINPIYFSNDDVKSKIENSERMYRKKNLKVVYKMTTNVYPSHLDYVLECAKYSLLDPTSVQVKSLKETEEPDKTNIVVYTKLHEKWFENFCILNDISEKNNPILKKILENIIPETYFVLVTNDSDIVLACGLGVLEDGYLGLFDIVTNPKYRNKGYGKKLINNLLFIGKENGATKAYLQVALTNIPALNMYSKLGFNEEYRYWYRVKK